METSARTPFRADVQGLRAIAVLTVIAGHAGVPFLPGGFVGVDVFFVISGFLISSLLFREVGRDGRFSIRDFYARRARRILPAATLVIVATVVLSNALISVVDAVGVVTDALWATFFGANIRFANTGTDYFAQEQTHSPLQHYWSLAVEEQFYVVWPLLLLLVLWLAKRRRSSTAGKAPLPRKLILGVLLAVGIASFSYGVWLTETNPVRAYFSTPARAWELAVGAVAALVAPWLAKRMNNRERGALALTGLVAIGTACFLFDSTTAFPGVAAAGPVLGAAALLVAGAREGGERQPLPVRAISVKPMRVVGDWSYSLYLWHWPLLVIPEIRGGQTPSPAVTVAAVVATFALAWLTYKFIETPFRNAKKLPRPRALALYPASVVLVATSCLGGKVYADWKIGGFGHNPAISATNFGATDESEVKLDKDPTVALVQASVLAARNKMAVPSDLSPDLLDVRLDVPELGECDYTIEGNRNICERGDPNGDKVLSVLGNSHGRMWIPAIEAIAKREGYKTYYFVKSNCTAADIMVSDLANNNAPWQECTDFREWAFDQIEELHPDLAITAASGPNPVIYANDKAYRKTDPDRLEVTKEGWASTLTRLKTMADSVALIRDVPKNEEEPGVCLTTGSPNLGDCMFTPMPDQELDSNASVDAAIETDTQYVDPLKWLCWEDQCPVVIGQVLPYRDRGHLTTIYSASLADELGTELGIWH